MKTRVKRLMGEFTTKVACMHEDMDMSLIPRMLLFGSIMEVKGRILEAYVLGHVSDADMFFVTDQTAGLIGLVCDACMAPSLASGTFTSDEDIAAEFRAIRELRTKMSNKPVATEVH